ncbi:hypothetical protein ABZ814_25000 [Micromonospora musae]|uniref:hypothetical protein n=1 Tax=Micromonospora musae TaxID=1894970 RepID=UPI0033E23245
MRVSAALAVVVAVIAGLGGYRIGLSRERHSATAVVLTGTVTWSNEETRLVAFETDGVVREPDDGDTIYSVLTDNWEDVAGTSRSDGTYPTCLAGKSEDPVSMDRHRAELTVIDWDTGGAQPMHVAVRVRCLD